VLYIHILKTIRAIARSEFDTDLIIKPLPEYILEMYIIESPKPLDVGDVVGRII
jgi:hypothetical protein